MFNPCPTPRLVPLSADAISIRLQQYFVDSIRPVDFVGTGSACDETRTEQYLMPVPLRSSYCANPLSTLSFSLLLLPSTMHRRQECIVQEPHCHEAPNRKTKPIHPPTWLLFWSLLLLLLRLLLLLQLLLSLRRECEGHGLSEERRGKPRWS